LEGKG
jgi:hypothetical protein